MNPLALLGLGLGGGYIGYKAIKGKTITRSDYQTIETTTPNGQPVKVATPVSGVVTVPQVQKVVTRPPTTGQYSPVPTTIPGQGVTYAPPGTIITTPKGQVAQPAPIIITKSGAASLAVGAVKDIQRALNTLGYAKPPLKEDGILGPKTAAAIKAFQAKMGLATDGNASAVVKAALSAALANAAGSNSVMGTIVQNNSPETGAVVAPNGALIDTKAAMAMSTKDIQYSLNGLGASPKLVVDGKLGPKTVAAIKSFQTAHGLVPDGIAGPKTKTVLYQLYPPTPAGVMKPAVQPRQVIPPSPGVMRPAVQPRQVIPAPTANVANAALKMTIKDVQSALNSLGASPKLVVDGKLGPKTTAAVKAFQASHGLTPDGIIGTQTKTAIYKLFHG